MSKKKAEGQEVFPENSKSIPEPVEQAPPETVVTPVVMCPVISEAGSCDAILELQPHPTILNRVVAYCNCKSIRRGLPVYEAPEQNSPVKED